MSNEEILKKIEMLKEEKAHVNASKCEVYSRVVGYLRPVSQWNEGKQEEFKIRKTSHIC